jgi:hypothetical protein
MLNSMLKIFVGSVMGGFEPPPPPREYATGLNGVTYAVIANRLKRIKVENIFGFKPPF